MLVIYGGIYHLRGIIREPGRAFRFFRNNARPRTTKITAATAHATGDCHENKFRHQAATGDS